MSTLNMPPLSTILAVVIVNKPISHSGSKAQQQGDTRNHVEKDPKALSQGYTVIWDPFNNATKLYIRSFAHTAAHIPIIYHIPNRSP